MWVPSSNKLHKLLRTEIKNKQISPFLTSIWQHIHNALDVLHVHHTYTGTYTSTHQIHLTPLIQLPYTPLVHVHRIHWYVLCHINVFHKPHLHCLTHHMQTTECTTSTPHTCCQIGSRSYSHLPPVLYCLINHHILTCDSKP